jgi:uncharacterized protein (TIGR02300 family)
MPNLGRKFTCYSCHTKFYDLGKPAPLCPKCGADQRDSDAGPVTTSHRGRRIIEAPVVEEELVEPEAEAEAEPEEDEFVVLVAGEEEEEDEDEEEA